MSQPRSVWEQEISFRGSSDAPEPDLAAKIQRGVRRVEDGMWKKPEGCYGKSLVSSSCTHSSSVRSKGVGILLGAVLLIGVLMIVGMMIPGMFLDLKAAAEERAAIKAQQELSEAESRFAAESRAQREREAEEKAKKLAEIEELLKTKEGREMLAGLQDGSGNDKSNTGSQLTPNAVYARANRVLDRFTQVKRAGVMGLMLTTDDPEPQRATALRLEFDTEEEAKTFYANAMLEVHQIHKDVVTRGGVTQTDIGQLIGGMTGIPLEPGTYYNQGTTVPISLQAADQRGTSVWFELDDLPEADMYLVDVSPGQRTDYYLVKN